VKTLIDEFSKLRSDAYTSDRRDKFHAPRSIKRYNG
jgi:hypothetical protein